VRAQRQGNDIKLSPTEEKNVIAIGGSTQRTEKQTGNTKNEKKGQKNDTSTVLKKKGKTNDLLEEASTLRPWKQGVRMAGGIKRNVKANRCGEDRAWCGRGAGGGEEVEAHGR